MTIIHNLPAVRLLPSTSSAPPAAERDEAEQLVADLAALLDAGLVTVRRQLGGPVRYGAVDEVGEAA